MATQNKTNQVDILLVVDNSLAMEPFQKTVGENLGSFFTFLDNSGVDYQIGVTSGDGLGFNSPGAGQGQFSALGGAAIVTAHTPNAATVLQHNLQLGNHGSSVQLPVYAAMAALGLVKAQHGTPPAGNQGFVREGARLAIIFLTDGDDASFAIEPENRTSQYTDFVEALRNLKGPGNLGLVFLQGILFDSSALYQQYFPSPAHPERQIAQTCGTPDSTKNQKASLELMNLLLNLPFPAYMSSICGSSLGSLQTLARQASGLNTTFALPEPADPTGEVECGNTDLHFCVTVNGVVRASTDFSFNEASNAVVFGSGFVPPAGAKVEIRYVIQTKNERREASDGGFFSTCQTESDCPEGVACSAGVCHLSCAQESDCQASYTCKASTRACACTDAACGAGQRCTIDGFCQTIPPCQLNSDCDAGQICEATTSTCQPAQHCIYNPDAGGSYEAYLTALVDCTKGTYCDGHQCVSGCFGVQDCPAGQACGPGYACVSGCTETEQCCLGQRCVSGACVNAPVVAAFALCDLASCTTNACYTANGACGSSYDTHFGCVPYEPDASECGKGYHLSNPPIIATTCTYGGHECTGGRVCTASLENPNGTCSCLSDADCSGFVAVSCTSTDSSGIKFCHHNQGPTCSPSFQCTELFESPGALCGDTF